MLTLYSMDEMAPAHMGKAKALARGVKIENVESKKNQKSTLPLTINKQEV